jgi:hypothetical protein
VPASALRREIYMRWKSRKTRLLAIVVVALGGVAVWGGIQVFAASTAQPAGLSALRPSVQVQTPYPAGGTPTLLRTYENWGSNIQVVPGGVLTDLDGPTSIHCDPPDPNTSCMVVAEMKVQLGGGPGGANRVAFVPLLDGNWISPAPYIGAVPSTYYQVFNWRDLAPHVHPGTHSIKTTVYTDAPAILAYYTIEYKVYWYHT